MDTEQQEQPAENEEVQENSTEEGEAPSTDGESSERFQPASMTFKWDGEIAETIVGDGKEPPKEFQPFSMVFQVDAVGEIVSSASVPLEAAYGPHPRLQPPIVCIFNHTFHGNEKKVRHGSEKDVEALFKTFGNLKCQVEEVKDPKKSDIKEKIANLSLKNFNHLSGVVIVILSHGGRKEKIETCDQQFYDLDDDVLFPLFRNKTLIGKPKILIVQACKDYMHRLQADSSIIDPVHSYYIKCYSTSEGLQSFRHTLEGSFYIQALCNEMDQHALTKDFKAIVEDVNVKVQNDCEKTGKQQVPAITVSAWTPFCFGDYVEHVS
ncbi:caspase-3 [Drosophila takahashii]|uniref:caspase-3 n=1 Tax=Drosophila takahashii TaxID=29030 RepID=UPI003898E4F3